MSDKRTTRDFLIDSDAEAPRFAGRSPDEKAAVVRAAGREYSDAELYRIIVAKAIHEGRFYSKAQFDLAARELATIEQADELLAMLERRPGCEAWRRGQLMVCECRVTWKDDDRRRARRPSGSS